MTQRDLAREAFFDALLDDDPQKLYDRAPCGFLSTTPDGSIVKVNETFSTWTGYPAQELVGRRRFVDLLTAGGRLYHETHYAPMLSMQGVVREIALDLVRADGQRLPVLVNATLERTQAGTPLLVRIAVFDATERRKYERELLRQKRRAEESEKQAQALSQALQQTFIPPAPPRIPGLDVAADFRAAARGVEVGGDFYDVFAVDEGDWVVVLGDVCGKGVEAAVVTTLVRHTLRAVVVGLHEPSHALAALNEVVLSHQTDRFCTVVLVRLRRQPTGWVASISSGGHPFAVLVSGDGRSTFHGGRGPLIGVIERPQFEDERLSLHLGDTLVLYTDGVTEGRRGHELYGEDRLLQQVGRHPADAAQLVDGLVSDVVEFQGGKPRDDIAVVAIGVPEG